jgi:parallel beta-helix repeat protein
MRTLGIALLAGLCLCLTTAASAKTITVHAGDSIQAAVDQANPGDTIKVFPGTYHEAGAPCPGDASHMCAVSVTKPGISLVGMSKHNPHDMGNDQGDHGKGKARGHHGQSDSGAVILENAGGQERGIGFAAADADPTTCANPDGTRMAGATVTGFTVNGFDGQGIYLLCVDQFAVRFNSVNDNGEYGIFPSHSTNGAVEFNLATGSNDTGIYIGQSANVHVDHNLARGNVSGFEIENCHDVRLDHNVSTGNTGGILSFTLPFLDVKQNAMNRIDHNWVQANNKENTCLDPTDAVCGVPTGTGILVLAADQNRVDHNLVLNNDSYGIAVANFCVAQQLTPDQCSALDIEPNSDDAHVDHNAVFGNGAHPSPLIQSVFAVDLAWDGTGTGNCWSMNAHQTQFPDVLPTCQ